MKVQAFKIYEQKQTIANAINLELFLTPDYYQATMERYKEIVKSKLLQVNQHK